MDSSLPKNHKDHKSDHRIDCKPIYKAAFQSFMNSIQPPRTKILAAIGGMVEPMASSGQHIRFPTLPPAVMAAMLTAPSVFTAA